MHPAPGRRRRMRRWVRCWQGIGAVLAAIPAVGAPSQALTAAVTATPAVCVGDCNDDGVVTVGELITGVTILLGNAAVTTCSGFDLGGEDTVTVSDLVAAVNNLLFGCWGVPPSVPSTPTHTPPSAAGTATATPSLSRTPTPTRTQTPTPTPPNSVCGGFVSTLPVLCNLVVVPNPVSRSGTIAYQFGVSDLNGDINEICLVLTYPLLEPEESCAAVSPTNRVINSIEMTNPVAASPLLFGTYQAQMQASDAAGHLSNIITATFQVQ